MRRNDQESAQVRIGNSRLEMTGRNTKLSYSWGRPDGTQNVPYSRVVKTTIFRKEKKV